MAKATDAVQKETSAVTSTPEDILPKPSRPETPVEIALRHQLEDETDRFLHVLYDALTPSLADTFRKLAKHGVRETKVLSELAHSFGLNIAAEEFAAPDSDVDRIVWRQVARSSTLALLTWLLSDQRRGGLRWQDWALWGCNGEKGKGVDYSRFRAETALGTDDIRLSVNVVAKALVESEALQKPTFLFFKGRRAVLLADGRQGTIASMWTGHALAWVNLGDATTQHARVTEDKGRRTVSIALPRGTAIDVVKLKSTVNIVEGASRLIFTQKIGEKALERDAPRVELTYGSNTQVVSTKTGVRLKLTDAGNLNVSSPGRTLEKFADGYLLEWDGPKNLLDGLSLER